MKLQGAVRRVEQDAAEDWVPIDVLPAGREPSQRIGKSLIQVFKSWRCRINIGYVMGKSMVIWRTPTSMKNRKEVPHFKVCPLRPPLILDLNAGIRRGKDAVLNNFVQPQLV